MHWLRCFLAVVLAFCSGFALAGALWTDVEMRWRKHQRAARRAWLEGDE